MTRRVAIPALVAGLMLPAPRGVEAARADDGMLLKVVPLKYRPAADLAPVLQSLAGPGGSVVALDSRLVIRATPEGQARIAEAVQTLDVPLRSLFITVSQARTRAAVQGSAGVDVAVSSDGARATHVATTGAFSASSGNQDQADVQRVSALEGYPALIRIGRSEPQATLGLLPSPHGPGVIMAGTT